MNIAGQRSVDESEMLELNCTSNRSAVLSWFKKENSSSLTKIVSSSRISITFRDIEGSSVAYSILTIRGVTVSDNNTYVCEAQDGDGLSRSANYTVQINGIAQKHNIAITSYTIIVWHNLLCIYTAVNECQNSPGICQNGGQCTDLERGYSCTCTDRFSGTNCEIPGKGVQKKS